MSKLFNAMSAGADKLVDKMAELGGHLAASKTFQIAVGVMSIGTGTRMGLSAAFAVAAGGPPLVLAALCVVGALGTAVFGGLGVLIISNALKNKQDGPASIEVPEESQGPVSPPPMPS